MYKEAVKIFYANLVCLVVSEVTEPVLRSHLLDVPTEFFVSSLCDILGLHNEGDHVFLFSFLKLSTASKIESEIFTKVVSSYIDCERVTTATQLNPDFRVICKLFIGNIVPQVDQKDVLYPLQALFMYALLTDWILNVGCIIFESLRVAHAGRTAPDPQLAKLPLLFGMLLMVIFEYFGAHLHRFSLSLLL